MDTLTQGQRQLIAGIAGLLVGIVITSLAFSLMDRVSQADSGETIVPREETSPLLSEQTAETPRQAVTVGTIDRVDVADQHASSVVQITSMSLADTSWVAVHEESDGKPGNVLGAGIFDAGVSRGVLELLRATSAGERYYVRLYRDDGDRVFDLQTDVLLVNEGRAAIQDTFYTLVDKKH